MSFANNYWSSDYRVGIDKLSQQSVQSLHQLHDLRRLVFNYMNYFYSNSEYLNRINKDAYQFNNKLDFLNPSSSNSHSSNSPSSSTKSTIKRLSDQFMEVTKLDAHPSIPKQATLNAYIEHSLIPYRLHMSQLNDESRSLVSLSSAIDAHCLGPLTSFIKDNEPIVKSMLNEFEYLLEGYVKCYKEIEKIKKEFEEISNLKELEDRKDRGEQVKTSDDEVDSSDEGDDSEEEEAVQPQQQRNEPSATRSDKRDDLARSLRFPLTVGTTKVADYETLKAFLLQISSEIETTKRKIPIPGYKNETFSSEQLCDWISRKRPFGLNPSRVNLERFGQSLIDLKIIVGMGFLGAKKFKSEGMWFEWANIPTTEDEEVAETENASSSAVASPITPSSSTTSTTGPGSATGQSSSLSTPVITTTNTSAPTTPKKSSSSSAAAILFTNMKSSILKTNYPQILIVLEERYNDAYLHLQSLRHNLDEHTFKATQRLEVFEKERIEISYKCLTKLSELLYNQSLSTSNRLHKFATDLISNVNAQENYEADFQKLMNTFSTGIYFPSILSPENLSRQHYSSHQANSNFQNVKLKFNLYKDFPLQPLVGGSAAASGEILSLVSIPEFLYRMIGLLNEREDEVAALWTAPLSGEKYWNMKQAIINLVSMFSPTGSSQVLEETTPASATTTTSSINADELTIHRKILDQIIIFCSHQPTPDLVNFLKNWFLEIGDSAIPFTIYDRILQTTEEKEEVSLPAPDAAVEEEAAETAEASAEKKDSTSRVCKLLSTIPRSNLSSLLYILEHISSIFELDTIPNFGYSDDLAEELITSEPDVEKLNTTAAELNSMDAIGSLPFLHLIMRPSAVKHTAGFKPPLLKYNAVLANLLNVDVRSKLFKTLVENERKYLSKRENEKKLPLPNTLISYSETIPKSPKPIHPENFTLRPFRTKATPNPSPSASPKHTPSNSLDATRPRSTSNTFLTPSINIEFGEKGK